MKHTNKKGFTIVELVIVIAVIAILAAVLIPTFTNLVKKANLSSDTQLVKNLNTILVADEAINGAPADFSEVIAIIKANGYIVENLNPTTAGHFVVWESTTNQFILVDGDFKVVYSAEKLESKDIQDTWFFAVKEPAVIAVIEEKGGKVIPAVDTAWIGGNGQTMEDLLNKGGVIALSENITLNTAPRHATQDSNDALRLLNANAIYSLAGQTLTATADFDTDGRSLIHVGESSNVVIKDGTIVATVTGTNTNNLSLYGVVRVFNGCTTTVENMNIVYNGAEVGAGGSGAVFVVSDDSSDNTSVLTVKDTVVTVANAMGAEIATGTAIFENVTFKNAGDGAWNDICVGVSYGGTATIKSGTYVAANAGDKDGFCVGVLTTGGTLKIEGGSFEGNLFIGTASNAVADSVIEITGGSFNGIAFADMTDADWKAIVTNDAAVITGVGTGTVTITVKKAN